jgi:hypothetical protein
MSLSTLGAYDLAIDFDHVHYFEFTAEGVGPVFNGIEIHVIFVQNHIIVFAWVRRQFQSEIKN